MLDIGDSYVARLLAAAVSPGGQVTGIHPSGTAVRYAQRRAPANCSFAIGAAQHLDLPDQSFNVVTSMLAAHDIPKRSRRSRPGSRCRPAVS